MVTIIRKDSSEKELKEAMQKLSERQKEKGVDTFKYCGIIRLKKDPLLIQKKMRNEWQ